MEDWGYMVTNYPAKVLNVDKLSVSCDCFICKEPLVVEIKEFPKILFDNVVDLKVGSNVLLTIGIKPGSTIMVISESNDDLNQLYGDGWEELNFENKRAF